MKKNKSLFQDPVAAHLLIGVGVGAAASFAAIALCAFVLTLHDFEPSAAAPMSNVCLALGAGVAGYVCSAAHRSKGLIMGAASGFILFLIVTVVSLLVNGVNMSANTPIRLAVMTLLAAAGGIIGVNRSSKRKMI